MGEIKNLKVSETGKRADLDYVEVDFWTGKVKRSTSIRLLSREDMRGSINDLVDEVMENPSRWKATKKGHQTCSLSKHGATAYILNTSPKPKEDTNDEG